MQWTDEADSKDPNLNHHALALAPNEPLAPAFVEFWRRILSDGCSNAVVSEWRSLAIDIAERQSEPDTQGAVRAVFHNAQNRACKGVGQYFLRSDALTCLQDPGEDNQEFNRKQIRWYLEQYRVLKEAARAPVVQQLFVRINAIRPLPIEAATAFGWFDLQIGRDTFGSLPNEDQAMLADCDPAPSNPMLDLIGGGDMMSILQELNAALIAYTPPNFDVICCKITEGFTQGERALFYDIACPHFPDDGTTVVNGRVHNAATRLVRQMAPTLGTFPGVSIRLEQHEDGNWRHSLQVLSQAAA
jgi:hypothetical protein